MEETENINYPIGPYELVLSKGSGITWDLQIPACCGVSDEAWLIMDDLEREQAMQEVRYKLVNQWIDGGYKQLEEGQES